MSEFFRGLGYSHSVGVSNPDEKLLQKSKAALLKSWIERRIEELLGHPDEIIADMVYAHLEEDKVDGKTLIVQLSGFLNERTDSFVTELWELLCEAEAHPLGIPQRLIDEKDRELQRKQQENKELESRINIVSGGAIKPQIVIVETEPGTRRWGPHGASDLPMGNDELLKAKAIQLLEGLANPN